MLPSFINDKKLQWNKVNNDLESKTWTTTIMRMDQLKLEYYDKNLHIEFISLLLFNFLVDNCKVSKSIIYRGFLSKDLCDLLEIQIKVIDELLELEPDSECIK